MAKFPILHDDNDGEIALPYRWVICPDCDGHGKSSLYLGAFTAEQMREDPDFADDYRDGMYDRTCDGCGGSGKRAVVDEKRTPRDQLRAYRAQQRDLADMRAIERQERLMEGGWREEGWFQ